MPGLKRGGAPGLGTPVGFRMPRAAGAAPAAADATPRTAPRTSRSPATGSSPFNAPKLNAPSPPTSGGAAAAAASPAGTRKVLYPETTGRTCDSATGAMVADRMSKLDGLNYHQPASAVAAAAPAARSASASRRSRS
jgi:hypothetical protein